MIRPRALTLTLWARLLVCDFFVHGIGGAKYDRITDGIFRRYYRCEPPPYGCVTATLRLPAASPAGRPRRPGGRPAAGCAICISTLSGTSKSPPLDLVAVRQQLIDQSNALREQAPMVWSADRSFTPSGRSMAACMNWPAIWLAVFWRSSPTSSGRSRAIKSRTAGSSSMPCSREAGSTCSPAGSSSPPSLLLFRPDV